MAVGGAAARAVAEVERAQAAAPQLRREGDRVVRAPLLLLDREEAAVLPHEGVRVDVALVRQLLPGPLDQLLAQPLREGPGQRALLPGGQPRPGEVRADGVDRVAERRILRQQVLERPEVQHAQVVVAVLDRAHRRRPAELGGIGLHDVAAVGHLHQGPRFHRPRHREVAQGQAVDLVRALARQQQHVALPLDHATGHGRPLRGRPARLPGLDDLRPASGQQAQRQHRAQHPSSLHLDRSFRCSLFG